MEYVQNRDFIALCKARAEYYPQCNTQGKNMFGAQPKLVE